MTRRVIEQNRPRVPPAGLNHRVVYAYNSDNNLSQTVETIGTDEKVTSYSYDDDNRTTEITTDGTTVAYTYDGFGRVSQQVTKTTENGQEKILLTEVFTYHKPSENTTSARIESYKTYAGEIGDSNLRAEYHYTYDENGNITSVYNGSKWIYYTYDSANQLTREDNQAAQISWKWTYNNAGNILKVEEFAYTAPETELGTDNTPVNYTYSSSIWGDLLTAYNGTAIGYDGIGNPLVHGSTRYTWEHGRQLASMTKDGTVWNYSYNNAGLRTGRTGTKTVNNVTTTTTYKYIYSGGLLMQMTKNNQTVDFTYDLGGRPLTMKVGGSTYYYVTNVQGDVMALLDAGGNVVVRYRYTAYGVAEITTGANTTAANFNPLTYRGYVYDSETGLYYLQSRYYDPSVGRFINADGLVATGQGLTGNNMFAYCGNNPTNRCDCSGDCWHWGLWVLGIPISCNQCTQDAVEVVVEVSSNVYEDVQNFDWDNTDESKVTEANYFSAYKGSFALIMPIDNEAFSYGIMFIGDEITDPNTVRHEYGHTVQFRELGAKNYTSAVAIPSLCGYWSGLKGAEYFSQPWEYEADIKGKVIGRRYEDDVESQYKAYRERLKELVK